MGVGSSDENGPRAGTWAIQRSAAEAGTVAIDIEGRKVWMSSDDAALEHVPEAWVTAFCIPASQWGTGFVLDEPVDAEWRAGAAANVAVTAAWWGGDPVLHLDAPEPLQHRRHRSGAHPPLTQSSGRGLCFTGGVDSFYSLLAGDHRPTHLVFVLGFDVNLEDVATSSATTAAVHAVAEGLGIEAVVVRTNLRTDRVFASTDWEHTHGAALAATGHLLHRTIGTLVIPPSYTTSRLVPWGSRPDIDHRWSLPGRLQIEHGNASGRRIDRVQAIASHPLVHEHLRVCWQNEDGQLNCGHCEKCLRTMIMLAAFDQLQHCRTFPDRAALPVALNELESLDRGHMPMWRDLEGLPLRAAERIALDALLARSDGRRLTRPEHGRPDPATPSEG